MLANTTTPDGYYVNTSGVWVQNAGNTTVGADSSAKYHFDRDDDFKSLEGGTWSKGKGWTYTKPDGTEAIGWTLIDGDYHYFNEYGWMYVDCDTPDGYRVDTNGVWIQ